MTTGKSHLHIKADSDKKQSTKLSRRCVHMLS